MRVLSEKAPQHSVAGSGQKERSDWAKWGVKSPSVNVRFRMHRLLNTCLKFLTGVLACSMIGIGVTAILLLAAWQILKAAYLYPDTEFLTLVQGKLLPGVELSQVVWLDHAAYDLLGLHLVEVPLWVWWGLSIVAVGIGIWLDHFSRRIGKPTE